MFNRIALAALIVVAACDKRAEPAKAGAQFTDEKLAAFIAYKKEMIPLEARALAEAIPQFAAGVTGEQAGKELSKKYGGLQEAALEKAGLTGSEVSALTLALRPLMTTVVSGKYAEKENADIDAKKAANEKLPPNADDNYPRNTTWIEQYATAKAEFEAKHGRAALECYLRKEAQFVELFEAEVEAGAKAAAAALQ